MTGNRDSAKRCAIWLLAVLLTTAFGTSAAEASAGASGQVHEGPRLVPPGTGSPQVERLRTALDRSGAGAAVASVNQAAVELPSPCWTNVIIQSQVENLLVTAEFDYFDDDTGMLRARTRLIVGPWERFTVCRSPHNWRTVIQSDDPGHPYLVAAEVEEPGTRRGLLRARTPFSFIGEWEIFTTINPPSKQRTATWFYSPSAGKYVSAQFDYSGMYYGSLRARLGSVGPWETFYW